MIVLSVVLGACSVSVITETTFVRLDEPIRVRGLECAVDEAVTEFRDFAEDVAGELTAEAAVDVLRQEEPGRFRDLNLDRERSTESRWVFVDERGRVRLAVDVQRVASQTWVISSLTRCADG